MIRLELRCTDPRHCLLALVRQDAEAGLVADVHMREGVPVGDDVRWSTLRYTVQVGPEYLPLACRHTTGVTLHPDTVRAFVADTPKGVRFIV